MVNDIASMSKEKALPLLKSIYGTYCQRVREIVAENKNKIALSWFIRDVYTSQNTKVVYCLYNPYNNLVKIGKTKNLSKRIKDFYACAIQLGIQEYNLQCFAAIYLPHDKDYAAVEHQMHETFNKYRVVGEWFKISKNKIVDYLRQIYNSPVNINGVDVYCGIPDILSLEIPKIIEYSDDNYAEYRYFLWNHSPIEYSSTIRRQYGIPIKDIFDICEKYQNKRIDDLIIEVLSSSISV